MERHRTQGALEKPSEAQSYQERIESASHDDRVTALVENLAWLNSTVDAPEVNAIATSYGISPEEVLEHACVVRLFRIIEEGTYGEA